MNRYTLATAVASLAALFLATPASAAFTKVQTFGQNQFNQPANMAIDPSNGNVVVADTNAHEIEVWTSGGTFVRRFGTQGAGAAQLQNPFGVGVSPVAPHDIYVADTNNHRVSQWTNDGNFIRNFGSIGTAPGQFASPRGIDFDSSGNVWVSDTGANHRIQLFNPDGTGPIRVLAGGGMFQYLSDIAVDSQGNVYGADRDRNVILKLNGNDGTQIGSFGGAGALSAPGALAVAPDGSVWVADANNHRFVRFDGGTGAVAETITGYTAPGGIIVSPDAPNNVFTMEFNNNATTRIDVYSNVPAPVLGKTITTTVVTGTVLYRPPGAKTFQKLSDIASIQSGSTLDTRRGTVRLTTATGTGSAPTQSADFNDGVFKVVQKAVKGGLSELTLGGGNFKRCGRAARAVAAGGAKSIRHLWGKGGGAFRTKGRYSSASIRGTRWLTDDRCNGTLTRVTEGSVVVRDFKRRKSITLKAGQKYLAKAPRR